MILCPKCFKENWMCTCMFDRPNVTTIIQRSTKMDYKPIETAPKTGEMLLLWKHGCKENGWRLGYWCHEKQHWVMDDNETLINPEFYMELPNPIDIGNIKSKWLDGQVTKEEVDAMAKHVCGVKND